MSTKIAKIVWKMFRDKYPDIDMPNKSKRNLIVYEFQRGHCLYCGVICKSPLCTDPASTLLEFTLDHIILSSDGGTYDFNNINGCCKPCNKLRGTIPYDQWMWIVKQPKGTWIDHVKEYCRKKFANASSVDDGKAK